MHHVATFNLLCRNTDY